MINSQQKTVFVGMSGGVDSSVTAFLLKKRGYNVVGVFMRCYNIDGCAERDAEDARRVAEHIGVPFYTWDFEEEYKKRVVEYMVEGYRAGITPNPDVMCNREIKFGLFLEKALAMGADFVATGHYVKIKKIAKVAKATKMVRAARFNNSSARFALFTADDPNKDQSYFLWTLTQKQLAHCIFPIGDYEKPKVREMARRAGLPTA
jgi:tRNA-specific 2-thiouridylase